MPCIPRFCLLLFIYRFCFRANKFAQSHRRDKVRQWMLFVRCGRFELTDRKNLDKCMPMGYVKMGSDNKKWKPLNIPCWLFTHNVVPYNQANAELSRPGSHSQIREPGSVHMHRPLWWGLMMWCHNPSHYSWQIDIFDDALVSSDWRRQGAS